MLGVTGVEMLIAFGLFSFLPILSFGVGFYKGVNKPKECDRYLQNNKRYIRYLEKKIDKVRKEVSDTKGA